MTESRSLENRAADCAQSIQKWVDTCENNEKLEMPPSPTLSVTSRGNRRRMAELVGQRLSSPVRKASSAQYRVMIMAEANIFVEHLPEAPGTIDEQLGRVISGVPRGASQHEAIEVMARQYCERSRELAKDCAGKIEWADLCSNLLQLLSKLGPEILKLSVSRGPWLSELKPTAPSPEDFIPHTMAVPEHGVPQRPDPADADLPKTPVFSMPSATSSDVSFVDPYSLNTPRPDVTLGLSHRSFTRLQRTALMMLQDESFVLSDPHQTQIGMRFPFLVVNSTCDEAGGNMIETENQAAVAGACALNILGDLQSIVTRITSQRNQGSSAKDHDETPPILFSVTTEGPLHELWVHYWVGEEYHMTCHRAWRMTRREDAIGFVQALASIVEWGRTAFRENVLNLLGQIEQPVLCGVLTSVDA